VGVDGHDTKGCGQRCDDLNPGGTVCSRLRGTNLGFVMTVYVINNMTIHNPAEYKAYVRDFMPVFSRHGGKVLAAQNAPAALEGAWPFDRTVLLAFSSRAAAEAWASSPEYQAIAAHRKAGTKSNVVMLDGIE
jgi:uncharacterized protein (DUF1330 family)